jgi:hypothetical protein
MLTVADYELIRRQFFLDHESARAIAKELGHWRKTVAKALVHPVPPGYRRSQRRKRPAIERYRPIIDAWLEEDQSRPRKQPHTAERIYERLCGKRPAEHVGQVARPDGGQGAGAQSSVQRGAGRGERSSSGRQESGRTAALRPAASGGAAGPAGLPRWRRGASPAGG